MSHIRTKKIVGNHYSYAGHKWWYDFGILPILFKPKDVSKYVRFLSEQYSMLTCQWNDDLNSEWVSRIYLAMKMVLSASVMLQSLEYAKKNNLRIVETYLEYYSVLMALRAMVFTAPLMTWNNGEIIKLAHGKTINVAGEIISRLDKSLAKRLLADVRYIKSYRELISYRAPSSGDAFPKLKSELDVLDICKLFVEIAQLQSEVLENSLAKNSRGTFTLLEAYIEKVCSSTMEDNEFFDDQDAYRILQLKKHHPIPTNILHMMSEGHIENFLGSWSAKGEANSGAFDPEENWRIIFDVP